MKTIIETVNLEEPEREVIKKAAEIIKQGGLVAFPTETVYGLGADGLKEEAANKIYQAKGRPSDNPLILHIASCEAMNQLAREIPMKAWLLANHFWPGPLTMVLKKKEGVPDQTTGGLKTVAIRMPSHPVALSLIKESGCVIAAPSANTSGKPSPTLAEHVYHDLNGKVDMVLDAGPVGIGIESTIVDLTEDIPVILRPGYITKAMLEEVVGQVTMDKAIMTENTDKQLKPKAPGMMYKHYAPNGELIIYEGAIEKVSKAINQSASEKEAMGYKTGIIATEESKDKYHSGVVKTVGSRKNEVSIAQGLYAVLREFDSLGCEYIYAESFQGNEFGQAIMNRLLKAAGHHIITLT